MPNDLTAADMAEHAVTLATGTGGTETRVFTAAYVAPDEAKMPGMLVFKDYKHRIVAMVNASNVRVVERLERGENVPPTPQPGGVTLTQLPVPGTAAAPSTAYFPPGAWSVNT